MSSAVLAAAGRAQDALALVRGVHRARQARKAALVGKRSTPAPAAAAAAAARPTGHKTRRAAALEAFTPAIERFELCIHCAGIPGSAWHLFDNVGGRWLGRGCRTPLDESLRREQLAPTSLGSSAAAPFSSDPTSPEIHTMPEEQTPAAAFEAAVARKVAELLPAAVAAQLPGAVRAELKSIFDQVATPAGIPPAAAPAKSSSKNALVATDRCPRGNHRGRCKECRPKAKS